MKIQRGNWLFTQTRICNRSRRQPRRLPDPRRCPPHHRPSKCRQPLNRRLPRRRRAALNLRDRRCQRDRLPHRSGRHLLQHRNAAPFSPPRRLTFRFLLSLLFVSPSPRLHLRHQNFSLRFLPRPANPQTGPQIRHLRLSAFLPIPPFSWPAFRAKSQSVRIDGRAPDRRKPARNYFSICAIENTNERKSNFPKCSL